MPSMGNTLPFVQMMLFFADSDSRLEYHRYLAFARTTDSGGNDLAAFLFRETKVWENMEKQRRVEIADVTHVGSQREIDGVAFALYCSFCGSDREHELLHDVGVRNAAVAESVVRIRFGRNGQRINMRRESKLSDGIRRKRRSRRLLGAVVRIQSGRNRRRKETIGIDPKDIIAGNDIRGTGEGEGECRTRTGHAAD